MAAAALVILAMVVTAGTLVVVALVVVVATAIALVIVLVRRGVQRPVETRSHRLGLLLIQQRDGLRAHAAAADGLEHVVQRESGVGARKGKLLLLGDRKGQAQVLEEVLNQESGLVIAVEGLGREHVHGARAARTGTDHLANLRHVEVVLLGEGEGVGHAHHGAGERDLVCELRGLALAGAAEAENLGGEGLEHLAHGFDIALGAAHDGREGAGDGPALAARHGAVEGVLAAHLGRTGDIARELGRARGEVDEIGAFLGAGEQTVTCEVDLLDIGGEPDHGEDDVGVTGGLGRGVGPGSALGDQGVGLGLRAVEDGERIARVEDVAGDGGAHDAGADERDLEGFGGHMCTPNRRVEMQSYQWAAGAAGRRRRWAIGAKGA